MTPELAATVEAAFAVLGGEVIDPPTLMPAALPLDLSGEAVRARLCVFSDALGEEYALRPDLTLPVAQAEAAARIGGASGERAWRYNARAFRLPATPGDPMEFTQIGYERFGAPAGPDTDIEIFTAVTRAIAATNTALGQVLLGDLAVFPAFAAALDLPETSAQALSRAFRQQGGVEAWLNGARQELPATSALAGRLAGASPQEAEALVGDLLALSGVHPQGARTVSEIAERLVSRSGTAASHEISEAAASLLREVLAVSGTVDEGLKALSALARREKITAALEPVLAALEARCTGIIAALPGVPVRFDTTFGRRFNYYDGFVFELFTPGASRARPVGAGGRYDSLIGELSRGAVSTTGLGGVVRPDRLSPQGKTSA